MRIYIVEQTSDHVGWDEYAGFAIAAPDEAEARTVAARKGVSDLWLDPSQARCRCVGEAAPDIEGGVLLVDFNAG